MFHVCLEAWRAEHNVEWGIERIKAFNKRPCKLCPYRDHCPFRGFKIRTAKRLMCFEDTRDYFMQIKEIMRIPSIVELETQIRRIAGEYFSEIAIKYPYNQTDVSFRVCRSASKLPLSEKVIDYLVTPLTRVRFAQATLKNPWIDQQVRYVTWYCVVEDRVILERGSAWRTALTVVQRDIYKRESLPATPTLIRRRRFEK